MHKERCSLFFIELPISLLVVTKYNNTKHLKIFIARLVYGYYSFLRRCL